MSEIKVKNLGASPISSGIVRIIISVILALAVSILLLLISAIVLTVTDISASAQSPIITFVTYFSVLLAGMIAGSRAKRRGYLRGALAGTFYLLAVRVLGWLTMGASSIGSLGGILLPGILVGAVGGILGINLFRKK